MSIILFTFYFIYSERIVFCFYTFRLKTRRACIELSRASSLARQFDSSCQTGCASTGQRWESFGDLPRKLIDRRRRHGLLCTCTRHTAPPRFVWLVLAQCFTCVCVCLLLVFAFITFASFSCFNLFLFFHRFQ